MCDLSTNMYFVDKSRVGSLSATLLNASALLSTYLESTNCTAPKKRMNLLLKYLYLMYFSVLMTCMIRKLFKSNQLKNNFFIINKSIKQIYFQLDQKAFTLECILLRNKNLKRNVFY